MAAILETVLTPSFAIYTALALFLFNATSFILSTLRPKAFPPGPRGIPGLGNLLQIDARLPFQTFSAWSKTYGADTPIGVKSAANNLVVLNSAHLVHELFDKRGAVYSDRPYMYINNEWITSTDLKFVLAVNASPWVTRWRKGLSHMLSGAAIKKLTPVYEAEAARFLVKVLEAGPDARGESLANLLLSWILSVQCLGLCGKRPDDLGGDLANIEVLRHAQQDWISLVTPGAGDVFPPLRYLPRVLAPWKDKAQHVRRGIIARIDNLLEAAHEQRAALDAGSTAYESLLAKMVRENSDEKDPFFTPSDIGMTAVTILSAATDTSLAVTSGILMVFARYPEIQQRVRDEVLQLSGGKPPTSAIIGNLKYLEACFYEFLRWRPPAPQAAAHASSKPDTFMGYVIPKASAVIANVWHIHHTAADFDAPDEFLPDRWLAHPFGMRPDAEHDAARLEAQGRRTSYAFGAGRRICPGMESAKKNLLLGMAKFVWAFDVSPPEGGEVDLSIETGYVSDLALRPKDFDVVVKLREGVSRQDVMAHYVETYQGEAEIMDWKDGRYL